MASANIVILLGNLTRDPEMRYLPSGAAVASFGLGWRGTRGAATAPATVAATAAWPSGRREPAAGCGG